WYNHLAFGGWTINGGYHGQLTSAGGVGLHSFLINIAGTVVSPLRGVATLSPFVLLLLPGIPKAWRSGAPWVRSAAAGGVLYLLIQLWLNRFSGGYNFYSYRLIIETL